ncbi:MAG TPA: alpha/beta hydrolase [Kofleriaceae bacterium]
MGLMEIRDGVRLYVDDRGRGGPPVVFVHAWSMSHRLWENQVAALMPHHRTIAYDQRGHGASDKPDGDYTMLAYAQDLDALLDKLAVKDAVLVGWSMGVWVVTTYMHHFAGRRIKKLGLVGGVPLLVNRDGWEHGMPPEVMQQLAMQLVADRALATQAFYKQLLNQNASQAMLDWIVRTSLDTPLAGAMASFQSVATDDLRPLLGSIRVPTGVFHGVQDGVPLSGARAMCELIANAKLYTFEHSGHFPHLEESQAFTQALARFIAE